MVDRSALAHAIAGASASALAVALFFPLDQLRVHEQLSAEPQEERQRFNILRALRLRLEAVGLAGLYQGLPSSLAAIVWANFVYFFAYNSMVKAPQLGLLLRARLAALGSSALPGGGRPTASGARASCLHTMRSSGAHDADRASRFGRAEDFFWPFRYNALKGPRAALTGPRAVLVPALAGVINVFASSPIFVVSTRLRAAAPGQYRDAMDCIREILAEGAPSLWSGLVPVCHAGSNPGLAEPRRTC